VAEAKAAPSSVVPHARADAVGSDADGGSPDTDAGEPPDDVTPDGRAEEPDVAWPGPIEEPPPLFSS
jgi:hypothetical protein